MKLKKAILRALDRAEYSVACSYEAHAHFGDPTPNALDRAWYWTGGFKEGFFEVIGPIKKPATPALLKRLPKLRRER